MPTFSQRRYIMARKPKPDFERYMKTLHCEEPDRVPLGDWHVDQLPKENYMGKKISACRIRWNSGTQPGLIASHPLLAFLNRFVLRRV